KLQPYLLASGGALEQILALKSNLHTGKKIIEENTVAGDLIRSFRDYEIDQGATAAERAHTISRLIQLALVGAIAGSSVIAFLLFRYFMQGINRGVQTLLLNIQLFRKKQPLAPPVIGTDEIAVLDKSVHERADEVAAALTMKRAFLDTMSREIRNPIESATEYLAQLSDGSLGPVSAEPKGLGGKAGRTPGELIGFVK